MKLKNTVLVLLNTITFAAMLFMNYASNANLFGHTTVADVAHKYDTLFAPADYAFVIWGVIFLLGLCFVIYQWTIINNDTQQYIKRTGIWFAVSNIANALWVYFWINEELKWCVVLILILLISLIILALKLKLELFDEPVRTIFFVWWPIAFYLGWIMVATIACIASALVYVGFTNTGAKEDVWTIVMIVVAMLLYIVLIQKRNLRESAMVGVWAFIAIAIRQWGAYNNIAVTAIIAAAILLILSLRHGYKNRYYAPQQKIKRNEWK